MNEATVALCGVGIAFIGMLISALVFGNTLRKTATAEAFERGKMAQRMTEAERDIASAHEKIRKNTDLIICVDKTLAELGSGQKYMIATLDELKVEMHEHMKASR